MLWFEMLVTLIYNLWTIDQMRFIWRTEWRLRRGKERRNRKESENLRHGRYISQSLSIRGTNKQYYANFRSIYNIVITDWKYFQAKELEIKEA